MSAMAFITTSKQLVLLSSTADFFSAFPIENQFYLLFSLFDHMHIKIILFSRKFKSEAVAHYYQRVICFTCYKSAIRMKLIN